MSFSNYIKETRMEMRHVSWPTRKQTVAYTAIVIAISFFVAFYLGLFDYVFTTLLSKYVL